MLKNWQIGAICFYVKDIDRTEAFYRDVMGLSPQRMSDEDGGNDWLLITIANNVELIFFKGDSRPGPTPIVVFGLEEGLIDDVVAELAAKGATIVTPVSHAPGGWSSEFSDPDGHQLSLYQSEDKPRRKAG